MTWKLFSSSYDKEILRLALPALGALAADPLVSLVDTAFVGRLGATSLAALGVNNAIFSLSFLVFNFLAYGTTPMISHALGRGDKVSAGRIAFQALCLGLFIGLLAIIALQALALPLLSLMGANDTLIEPAESYLRIRALAGPAVLLITAANGIFRGFQDTRTPFIVTIWLNLVNIVLDPLFIFVFGWGIVGAAWATTIAQWFGAGWFIWLVLVSKRDSFHVSIEFPGFKAFLPFLRIGWELAVRTFSLVFALTLATAVATRLGVVEVAAHQVAVQLWIFLALIVDALAIPAQTLVSRYLGEGKAQLARSVANRLLQMGLGVGVFLGIGFVLSRPYLARLFSDDPLVVSTVLTVFPFVALMQPLNALVFVWDGIFMGMEAFRFLARAMVFAAVISSLILLLVLPMGWGLIGVWWGMTLLLVLRLAVMAYRYFKVAL